MALPEMKDPRVAGMEVANGAGMLNDFPGMEIVQLNNFVRWKRTREKELET